jgi:hypothetical protein
MLEDATVYFVDGESVDVDRVKFKDSGFIGVRADNGWVYYPREAIGRVVSRD